MRFLWVGIVSFALIVGQISSPVMAVESGDIASQVDQAVDLVAEQESQSDEATTDEMVPLPVSTPAAEVLLDIPEQAPQPTKRTPLITEIQVSGKCILPACASTNSAEFVELFNPNDTELSLDGYHLDFQNKAGTKTTLTTFSDAIILQPKQFVIVARDFAPENATLLASVKTALTDDNGTVMLIDATNTVVDQVAWGSDMTVGFYGGKAASAPKTDKSLQRCFVGGQLREFDPRSTVEEFVVYSNELPTPGVGLECVVPAPLQPVNICEGLRINEIAANTVNQFVELRNTTDSELSLAGCQLQTNRSMTKSYVFGEEMLSAGGYIVVHIKDTPLTLTKTTSGIVYVLSSDGLSEVDVQAYTNLAVDTSWARSEDDSWAQTYALTPGSENVIQKYLPCADGYERNESTGRCNKIVVPATLTDCGDDKYRSEDTGRCRNIPAASILAACKLGQYRSEETNRCRNIVTASTQKPCKDNQYRSEETNRCRNLPVASVPDAAFAVQPIKDTGMAFVGWWALGGVSLLALGYAGWEWRTEIVSLSLRLVTKLRLK